MKLYLLRHADAGEPLDARLFDDTRRPLTPKGRKRTRQLANALRQFGIQFQAIFTSPYARARETAEIIARSQQARQRLKDCEALIPGSDFKGVMAELERLAPAADAVLLVGHKPHLGHLISWLCTGEISLDVELKKGGLCRLELSFEGSGIRPRVTLEWLLSSRHFGPKRGTRPK